MSFLLSFLLEMFTPIEFIFNYTCIHVCTCMWVGHICIACVWRSQDNSQVSVGPGNQTQSWQETLPWWLLFNSKKTFFHGSFASIFSLFFSSIHFYPFKNLIPSPPPPHTNASFILLGNQNISSLDSNGYHHTLASVIKSKYLLSFSYVQGTQVWRKREDKALHRDYEVTQRTGREQT